MSDKSLLDNIDSPHQLRRLDEAQLGQLAEELRDRIVSVVSTNGGHLASNLGVAELTVALHYVFDFSRDRLVWDVGHQCYAHKLLTGRAGRFDTLRRQGGVSGYPNPTESQYDLFTTGHAGSAVSLAAGLARADDEQGINARSVAVVGDASIVNGMAFEGINNAALLNRQFLIILNDNSMAIDRTHGAVAELLDRIRITHTYEDMKHSAEYLLNHIPMGEEISRAIRDLKAGVKTAIHGAQMFESLGLAYFGPVDGHNVRSLIRILRRLGEIDRPVLLHVHTQKGRGCEYAVEDPCQFHSTSAHQIKNGRAVFAPKTRPTWTDTFADAILASGGEDDKLRIITAAMPDGTGAVKFREKYPDRCIDVGISESHAVAAAAGMAKAGLRPVVAIYSTFLQRAFDQTFHEVSLQKLPVVFCLDRAGLVGSDGPTHHGTMDISFLRVLPGFVLLSPADAAEMSAAMDFALGCDCPTAIRYPREEVPPELPGRCPPFELGRARTIREGEDAIFLAYGAVVARAVEAAELLQEREGLDVAVINARFAKPLDAVAITGAINSARPVVVCEDHCVAGGFGSAVMELAAQRGLNTDRVRLVGVPDRYVAHAPREQQLAEVGLDAEGLAQTMKTLIETPAGASQRISK